MASLGGAHVDLSDDNLKELNVDHALIDGMISSGQLSPLRRSTRVSALRAAEKIRGGEGTHINGNIYENEDGDEFEMAHTSHMDYIQTNGAANHNEDDDDEASNKRRRLASNYVLDQFDSHFAIQLDDKGDVILLSEDSDEEDMDDADKLKLRRQSDILTRAEPNAEQRHARKRMISQLKADLRVEEANLLMLKKLRNSQQAPTKEPQRAAVSANQATNLSRHGAHQTNAQKAQGNVQQNMNRALAAAAMLSQQFAQQQASQQGGRNMGATPPAAHMNTLMQQQLQQSVIQAPPQAHQKSTGAVNLSRNQQPTPPAPAVQNVPVSQNVQQQPAAQADPVARQMQAKLALRKQLEKTLLAIPPPATPKTELSFIPKGDHPDFVTLLGLDQCVQRVLRDKSVVNPHLPTPWSCCQCHTDFTPSWHTVRNDNYDLKKENKLKEIKMEEDVKPSTENVDAAEWDLYCDSCARTNSKRAVTKEHTARFKAEFVTALKREQDIETMKDGNIDWSRLGLDAPPVQSSNAQRMASSHASTSALQAMTNMNGMQNSNNTSQYYQQPTQNSNYHKSSSSSNLAMSGSSVSKQQQAAAAALRVAQQQQQSSLNNPMVAAAAAALQNPSLFGGIANAWQANLAMSAMAAQQQQQRSNNSMSGMTPQMALLLAQAAASSNMQPNMLNMPKDMLAMQQRLFMENINMLPKQNSKYN